MLPGPILIRKCHHCNSLFKQNTLSSGNTFGAKFWSDGVAAAPMLPRGATFYKCQVCGSVGPIQDAVVVDSYETYFGFFAITDPQRFEAESAKKRSTKERYKSVDAFQAASTVEALQFVNGLLSTTQEEEHELGLRLAAWRMGNDWRRGGIKIPHTSAEIANMDAILMMTQPRNQSFRLWRIEILRELSCYAEAKNEVELIARTYQNEIFLDAQYRLISCKINSIEIILEN